MEKNLKVGAYYFPNYHADKHNNKYYYEGWTEWDLMKKATPRYEGHQQPKVPLWGYEDEADPKVMAKKIAAAKKYGVDCFVFDAYFYAGGETFLDRCLDEGFLKAENCNDIEFALMWANHKWSDIHPWDGNKPFKVRFDDVISEEDFVSITDYIIDKYFTQPNYFRYDGKLYFSFYQLDNLVQQFHGIQAVKKLLEGFRARARAKVGELHINVIAGECSILPGDKIDLNYENLMALGVDSITSYTWLHMFQADTFPDYPYVDIRDRYLGVVEEIMDKAPLNYIPNISMGWDSAPRCTDEKEYECIGYPFCPALRGNTPKEFGIAMKEISKLAVNKMESPFVLINAWNEWTEGSYLEPDEINGYAYLEEIKTTKENL